MPRFGGGSSKIVKEFVEKLIKGVDDIPGSAFRPDVTARPKPSVDLPRSPLPDGTPTPRPGATPRDPSTYMHQYDGVTIRNQGLAGSTHPTTGVPFDAYGFPDFSAHRHPDVPDVRIELTGSRGQDFAAANREAGLPATPRGYTWHHHQDPGLMQLVDAGIHRNTGHTGGFSAGGAQ